MAKGDKTMANEEITNTKTEATTADTVVVPVPDPGQALTVTVEAEQIPQLSFDPGTESTQEFVGSDLVFTLDNTFFRSPTPVAIFCISPNPLCTCSSLSLTCLKDSPSRFSRVV